MYLDHTLANNGTLVLLLGGVTASYIFFLLGVAVYNAFFHPLAAFSGPKLRAAFFWPDSLSMWNGTHTKDVEQLHKKYGSVVRISPTQLSFTTSQAWKDIYGFRPGKKQIVKDPNFYILDKNDKLPRSLITSDDANHSRGRRLLSNAFSDSALRSQEPILTYYFEQLITRLTQQIDSPAAGKVNMVAWYNFTTFDIIGDLAFGESFHALENGDYHPWIRNIFRSIKFGRFARIGARYRLLGLMMKKVFQLFPSTRRARNTHIDFTRAQAEKRMDTQTDRKDFMTYILRHNDSEKGMSRDEIVSNSSLLIIAGSETTATLLSGCTYYLLRNPSALSRLQAEVRSTFSAPSEITLLTTGRLPYLHAVLEESFRMYPPVPSILPRLTGEEGDMVDGHFVPGGTSIGVHQLSAYRSPANFAQPELFAPERWLEGKDRPDEFRMDDLAALQPFSIGPRNCLGKNLAYNEMRAILARVVWHFDMELCAESEHWSDQKTWVLWDKPGLYVKLRKREM